MFFFDFYGMIILIPAMLFAFYAQNKVKSAYNNWSQVQASSGLSGAHVARQILDRSGLNHVGIELSRGHLTDHYDPKSQTVRLSQEVYSGRSIASVAIAAHEVGHAVQHGTGYFALSLRNNFFPVARLGSGLAMPLFLIGFLFNGPLLMDIGILFFIFALFFQVVTLPVEFNASSRAIEMLHENNLVMSQEEGKMRSVLNAAALTYVAATAVALSQLIRLFLLRGRRR